MGEIDAANSRAHNVNFKGGLQRLLGKGTRPYLFLFLILALFEIITTAMTYPLALRAGDALLGSDSNALNDSYLSVWIFGWQAHQLLIDPLHLFEGNIFYPS